MATNFPTSLDDGTSIPNPTGTNTQNSPDHAALHSNTGDGLKAVEAKLGIGASTPVVSRLLFGTGTGTSAWTQLTSAQLAASLSDETGTGSAVFATTPTLVTPKVDTINEATGGNGTSINGVLLKSSKMNGSFVTDGTITFSQLATGTPVQVASTSTTAVATGTTIIPEDDTIPQNTEGNEYMSLAITPKSATNVLVITATAFLSNSVTGDLISALFQDSTANALAVNLIYQPTATGMVSVPLIHTMVAATTSSTTFKIRCGGNAAGTTTFNGQGGARKFGAITKSSITIMEYKA